MGALTAADNGTTTASALNFIILIYSRCYAHEPQGRVMVMKSPEVMLKNEIDS